MKTKCHVVALVLAAGLLFWVAQAAHADWTLNGSTLSDDNWTLTVSVSGGNYTVTGYSAGSGDLDLRNTGLNITAIGNGAFQSKPAVTNVFLPNTVTAIGDSAFRGMTGLTNIVLSANLVSIANCAFFSSTKLVSVTPFLPDTVTTVGPSAFYSCTALKGALRLCNPNVEVAIADGNTYGGFMNSKISSADLSSVTFIGTDSIRGISTLTNVVLSTALKTIGNTAFYGDSSLVSVSPLLPDSVTYVGREAFSGCSALTNALMLGLGTSPVRMGGSSSFAGTKIDAAMLGVMVTNVPSSTFSSCSKLQRMYLGGYPAFNSQWLGSTVPTNYQVRCYIPRGNTNWEAFAATGVVALTASETNRFVANYPAEKMPVGTWVPTGGTRQWYSLWTAPQDQHRGTVIYVQ